MKILIMCKKHHRKFRETLKASTSEPYLKYENPMFPGGQAFVGLDFQVEIRPYLKKMYLVDTDKFEMKHPLKDWQLINLEKIRKSGLGVA